MSDDDFDYMSISYEMKIADKDRLIEIGRCLSRETTVSPEVMAKLRGLYSRLMDHLNRRQRRSRR